MAGWRRTVQCAGFILAITQASWCGDRVLAAAGPAKGLEIVRTIYDPATGWQWALERDPGNPGGPGRLEMLATQPIADLPAAARPVCVVHSGDRIVVVEHSRVVDLRLEAVALERAAEGELLLARLAMGGSILRVRAGCQGYADPIGGTER